MKIGIKSESRVPIYLQIMEQIGGMLSSGMIKAGDKLPSVRELSIELGVNPNTVARAYRDLQSKEVIISRRGEGCFISDSISAPPSTDKKSVLNVTGNLISQNESHVEASDVLTKTPVMCNTASAIQQANSRENKFAVLAIRDEGHFHEDMNRHLVSNLQKKGIIPVSVHLDKNKEMLERGLDEVMSLNPLSIIIDGNSAKNIMDYLAANSARFGSVTFIMDKPLQVSGKFKSQCVLSDYWFGSYMATKYLIGLGHKKIMLMTHKWIYTPEEFRLSIGYKFEEGYRMALMEAGLQDFEQHFYDNNDCKIEFAKILSSNEPPTAILASEDFRLITKLDCFRRSGIRIPDDISLIGYYNTPWSRVTDIELSSVSIREDLIASKVAELLSREDKSNEIVVKPELILRNSCSSPRPADGGHACESNSVKTVGVQASACSF